MPLRQYAENFGGFAGAAVWFRSGVAEQPTLQMPAALYPAGRLQHIGSTADAAAGARGTAAALSLRYIRSVAENQGDFALAQHALRHAAERLHQAAMAIGPHQDIIGAQRIAFVHDELVRRLHTIVDDPD